MNKMNISKVYDIYDYPAIINLDHVSAIISSVISDSEDRENQSAINLFDGSSVTLFGTPDEVLEKLKRGLI